MLEETNFRDAELNSVTETVDPSKRKWFVLLGRLIFVYLSLTRGVSSSSSSIQNIFRRYSLNHTRTVFALLYVIVSSDVLSASHNDRGIPRRIVDFIRSSASLVPLLTLVAGISKNNQPELLLGGSDPQVAEPSTQRIVSTEFVGRFLLADALSSLALLVIPLYDIQGAARRLLKRYIPLDESTCSSCGTCAVVLPRRARPCGDVYCYFCIASESKFNCYRCQHPVVGFITSS